jgi:hypothetical protein
MGGKASNVRQEDEFQRQTQITEKLILKALPREQSKKTKNQVGMRLAYY